MNSLAMALCWAAALGRDPAEVDRLTSELIELSTRHNFVYWLALGAINRGWARSALGNPRRRYFVDRAGNRRSPSNRYGAGPPISLVAKG